MDLVSIPELDWKLAVKDQLLGFLLIGIKISTESKTLILEFVEWTGNKKADLKFINCGFLQVREYGIMANLNNKDLRDYLGYFFNEVIIDCDKELKITMLLARKAKEITLFIWNPDRVLLIQDD